MLKHLLAPGFCSQGRQQWPLTTSHAVCAASCISLDLGLCPVLGNVQTQEVICNSGLLLSAALCAWSSLALGTLCFSTQSLVRGVAQGVPSALFATCLARMKDISSVQVPVTALQSPRPHCPCLHRAHDSFLLFGYAAF
jgi:hypothetical protein